LINQGREERSVERGQVGHDHFTTPAQG
jgi:hypothetical protein